jgi:hypothetical protein
MLVSRMSITVFKPYWFDRGPFDRGLDHLRFLPVVGLFPCGRNGPLQLHANLHAVSADLK